MVKIFGGSKANPVLQKLGALPLFTQLSRRELRIVEGLLHQRDYLANEIVFDEGEEGQAFYIVLKGSVVIRRQGQEAEDRIARLAAGAHFGDLALLDASPRSAQAVAVEPSTLGVFFREDFLAMMDTHARIASKIALQLARQMGQRLREQRGAAVLQHM